ncbi:MAG: type II secretion system protein [Clostridia bacterium]
MKKLQTKKSNTGITLITLVITIVVLSILAGVSINTVVGDDGIIQKAKEQAEATRRASAEEEMNRLVLEYQLASKDETLESFLQEKVTEGRIDGVTDNGDGTITITKKVEGKDYTITVKKPAAPTPSVKVGAIRVVSDSTGAGSSLGEASTRKGTTLYIMIESTISGGTTTVSPEVPYAVTENGTYKFTVTGTVNGTAYTKEVSVEVNQFKNSILEDINIKIGDSVNYTYDSAGSYSLSSAYSGYSNQTIAQTTGLTWKVLNVDKENDTVDIISTNPTSSTVYFKGILGYNNGPYFMNEICKAQYSNKTLGVEARNINLLDMEKHLTPTGIKSRNEYNKGDSTYAKYGTTKTYTSNTKYPSLYANQKGAGPNVSTISQPDITKGNDPYEESKPIVQKNTTEPTNDSTYGTGSPLTVTQTYYNISINDTNYGTASSILANSTYFWVAARYVGTSSSTAIFGLRFARTDTYGGYMFFSGGDTDGINYALRPIVSLPSRLLTGEPTNGAWNLSK